MILTQIFFKSEAEAEALMLLMREILFGSLKQGGNVEIVTIDGSLSIRQ